MDIAEASKIRSTCLSRQVSAVIIKDKKIISTGYNGSPSNTIHCTDIGYCLRRKRKIPSGRGLEICRAAHAEANAITQCAKHGISSQGATIYVTTQPCTACCILIIQAGISKVVFKGEYPTGLGLQLLKEANIEFIKYEDELEKELKLMEEKAIIDLNRTQEFLSKRLDY